MQMAPRNTSPQPRMLQTEILRNQNSPMHPNDPSSLLLHTTMPILLESPNRRPQNRMGRNQTSTMGPARTDNRRKHQSPTPNPHRLQSQPPNRQTKIQRSPNPKTRSHKPHWRTDTLQTRKRTDPRFPQKRIHDLPSHKRNPTSNSRSTRRGTHTTIHKPLRPKRANLQTSLPTTNPKSLGKTQSNPLHAPQLQMSHSDPHDTHNQT